MGCVPRYFKGQCSDPLTICASGLNVFQLVPPLLVFPTFLVHGINRLPLPAVAIATQYTIPPTPPINLPRPDDGHSIIRYSDLRPTDLTHFYPSKNQLVKASLSAADMNAQAPLYEGYTFIKAPGFPGQKSTWGRTERIKLSLSQDELFRLVQKGSREAPIPQQYQCLPRTKQALVSDLIKQKELVDSRFRWKYAYIEETKKPVTCGNFRGGDYETLSLDVVILREPVDASNPDATRDPLQANPALEGSFRYVKPNDDTAVPVPRQHYRKSPHGQPPPPPRPYPHPNPTQNSAGYQQAPAMMSLVRRQDSPPPPQSPFPPQPAPMPNDPTQLVGQWLWPQGYTYTGYVQPVYGPPPMTPMQPPGSYYDAYEPYPRRRQNHEYAGFVPHAPEAPEILKVSEDIDRDSVGKTANLVTGDEFSWDEFSCGSESSDTDVETTLSDNGDESSATEDLSEEEKDNPHRGSLYKTDSTPELKNPEPVYRMHRRKSPHNNDNIRNLTGSREAVPASHAPVAPAQPRKITVQGTRRPTIATHEPDVSPAVLDVYSDDEEDLRGRVRNDLRSELLDNREARLELRENLMAHHARMMAGKRVDARYLKKRRKSQPPLRRRALPDVY